MDVHFQFCCGWILGLQVLKKRSKLRIYYDILKVLSFGFCDDNLSLTKLSHSVNLPYDRFIKSLDMLIHLGMVSRVGKKIFVTEKGREYIKEFERMNAFLASVGLSI
jgi:predicted transcriptional regulator